MLTFRAFLLEALDREQTFALLKSRLYRTHDWTAVHFVLPDGTMLEHNESTHFAAMSGIGLNLWEVLQLGVLRVSRPSHTGAPTGFEAGGPITDRQAQAILDAAQFSDEPMSLDAVGIDHGSHRPMSVGSMMFELAADRITADAIRHWFAGRF